MPYEVVEPILIKIQNPEQLRQIEVASPQIIGQTAELWKKFIQRDVENWRQKNYQPKHGGDWYAVYRKYMAEQKVKIDHDKEQLRIAMAGIKKEQTSNLSQRVESRFLPRPPKDPRMLANNGGVPISSRNKSGSSGRRLTPMSYIGPVGTGIKRSVNIVQKARREAAMVIAARRQVKAYVPDIRSQIKKAPAGMVEQYRKAAEEEKRKKSPRNSVSPPTGVLPARNSAIDDREARLRAIKASGAKKPVAPEEPYLAPPQVLDFSASSDEAANATNNNDDDDIEKLFGEYHERQLSGTAKRKLHGNDYADPFIHQPSPVKPATKRTTDIPPEEWNSHLAKRKSASPPVSRPTSSQGMIGRAKDGSPPAQQKRIFKRPPPCDPFFTPKKPRRS